MFDLFTIEIEMNNTRFSVSDVQIQHLPNTLHAPGLASYM